MSTHKNIDRICIITIILTLLVTVLFMNGERLGVQVIADQDAESYEGNEYFSDNDLDGTWDVASSTVITLNGDTAKVSGSGAYAYDGNVYITQSGFYEISGDLTDGSIIVDSHNYSKVWILLNGVTVNCSDDACIRVEGADKVFLTLAEGTENDLTSGAEYSEEALEDGTGGAIYAHDDLTINGSGSLTVTAEYQHGIEANDELTITGGTITVEAPADAINVNEAFAFTGADLTITAGDDAIHSDTGIYVLGGSITVNSCYEGLEAQVVEIYDGEVTISATDDGINANGGSTTGFGMGPMGGSTDAAAAETAEETAGEMAEGTEEDETYVLIAGGSLTILNSEGRDADGIDSNGDVIITGGSVFVSMSGASGGNNAIDFGSESGGTATISGGTVMAFGGSSMLENPDSSSGQCSITYLCSGEAGTTVTILDAEGKELLSCEVPYAFSAATLSCPELSVGETYTITVGDTSEEITLEGTVTSAGTAGTSQGTLDSWMSEMGGMGHMGGFGNAENSAEENDGTAPESAEESAADSIGGRTGRRRGGRKDSMTSAGESSSGGSGMPEMPAMSEDGGMPEMPAMGEDGEMPTAGMQGGQHGMQGMHEMAQEAGTEDAAAAADTAPSAEEVLLLCGLSALVLAGGIVIAWRHRSFLV